MSTQKEREELWQQFGGVNLGAEPVEDDPTASATDDCPF